LLIDPIEYCIPGSAGIGGSNRAIPYALTYAIFPPCTTATEALGTPVAVSTSAAAMSIPFAVADGKMFCAIIGTTAAITHENPKIRVTCIDIFFIPERLSAFPQVSQPAS
jgi:hypothetical protein